MFIRENEFLLTSKNIAEELLEMQTPEGVKVQAYRLLDLADKWQKLESQRNEGSSFLKRFPLNPSNP